MAKKYSKKTSIYRKISHIAMRNKRESLIVICLTIVVLALLSVGLFNERAARADEENVTRMRANVKELVTRIEGSGNEIDMKDESFCVVRQARAFSEKIYRECTAEYLYIKQVASQVELNEFIGSVTASLQENDDIISDLNASTSASVRLSEHANRNSYHTATSFNLKGVDLDGRPCFARYVVLGTRDKIELHLECTVEVREAYFQPIVLE